VHFVTRAHLSFATTEAALKILYISQYYPPEISAPSARVSELSQHWAKSGHDVTVLTGFPNHPDGVLRPDYRRHFHRLIFRERMNEVNVVRSWLLPLPVRKPVQRMLNCISFFLSASLSGSFVARPDLIIASSPQLLVGLTGWWLSKVHRVPFVFEVRDLWPESLVAVGVEKTNSVLYRVLEKIAAFLYERADQIVVVTPAFRERLISKWRVPAGKISVVPNGVETNIFSPRKESAALRSEFGAENKFIVSFIGTIGLAHGLENLVSAAENLQQIDPGILFLVIGEGADRERIVEMAHAKRVTNIQFVPQQPREKIPDYIAASDACLVLLRKSEVFETVIPTKMLEFMSCARPVILGLKGQAREILDSARAGICVEPGDPAALCDAILRLRNDADLRREFGWNGRDYITRNLSRERTAADYLELLNEFVGLERLANVAAA
jgi:colanic acid biosynthesis glycosyl transferase WcaI